MRCLCHCLSGIGFAVGALLFTGVLASQARAQTQAPARPPTQTPTQTPTQAQTRESTEAAILEISLALKSANAATFEGGLDRLKKLVAEKPFIGQSMLRKSWFEPLAKHGKFEEIDNIALQGIIARPFMSGFVADLQWCRAEAMIRSNPKTSVAAAKAYYATCLINDNQDATDLVAQAMRASALFTEDDISLFKKQQIAGEAMPHDLTKPQTLGADLGENVLAKVTIEPSLLGSLIGDTGEKNEFRHFTGQGNLLLLVGRPAEAQAEFEGSLKVANETQKVFAVENIARAIRAQDGLTGRAAAYLQVNRADKSATRPTSK